MKLNQQFAVLFFILRHVNTYKPWNYNGSTPHLQELFTGRCWEYQLLDPVNREENLRVDVNCTEAWGLFRVAFATKNPCKNLTTADDYKMFFEKIKNTKHLSNKAMFWSGTRTIVHDFTHVNTDYVTLEDTFTGFVANNLDWCGCDTCPDGINTKFCDASCLYPTWSYWDSVSKQFAEKAADTVYVMVNGTSKGINTAYYRETTFGRIELPTLCSTGQVKHLSILVVFDLDEEPKESCDKGTLVQMVQDAKQHGIPSTSCTDNPKMVNSILCAKYPGAMQCQHKNPDDKSVWKFATYVFISSTLLLLVVATALAFCLLQQRKKFRSFATNPELLVALSNTKTNI